jgi:hypothetical protein
MSNKERTDYGRDNQSVTPAYRETTTRSDGKESTIYGNRDGTSNHGHSVRSADGKVEYSRTIGGNVLKDK